MNLTNTILIASDQLASLSKILKFLKQVPEYNYVSATDAENVVQMLDLISPKLLVLCFDDNKKVMQDLGPLVEQSKIPVLCLCTGADDFMWSKYSIVFRQDLKQSLQKDQLPLLINSILLLQKQGNQQAMQTALFNEISEQLHETPATPSYELELEQKVGVLKKVKALIRDLYDEVDDPVKNRLLSIANIIKVSISDEKHWEDFKIQFNDTHKGFIHKLNGRHPNLTTRDIKYCCYLRIGMSNEDIRHILGINQESVSTHKYRLKRKLKLTKEQNLRRYIDQMSV